MKVVMTGGGTAGHVNPALAIAEIIKSREPDSEIEFIGTVGKIESVLVPKAGYKLNTVDVRGLKRSLSPENLVVLYKACSSYFESRRLLAKIAPDAVIGTGGYVSWPVCRAAVSLGIPTFMHEANAVPGVAVKALDGKADVIFVNFEETVKLLKSGKTQKLRVGMPVNNAFLTLDRQSLIKEKSNSSGYRRTILSFGGSLGAAKLNSVILSFIADYISAHPEVYFVHVTGKHGYDSFMNRLKEAGIKLPENAEIHDYVYDMPQRMLRADLVISRSGASTMSEIAVSGRPSVLIPSPNVTNNQQYKNAKVFADNNAACLIEDSELTAKLLGETVDRLLGNPEALAAMEENARSFAVFDTDERIYRCVRDTIDRKKAGNKA